MAKRFSWREMALLTAPVLVIGAMGLWVSKRPDSLTTKKPYLSFQLEKPTALEAFRGANVSCVVTITNLSSFDGGTWQMSPYVELKTPQGIEVGRQYKNYSLEWNQNLWNYTSSNGFRKRFLLKTAAIPAGKLRFGVDAVVPPNSGNVPPTNPDFRTKPLRLSGKWKVDRAKIPFSNLAAWPRKPFVSVREVKIIRVELSKTPKTSPHRITGEVVFQLKGGAMDGKTSFAIDFSEHHFTPRNLSSYGMGWTTTNGRDSGRTRIREWTVHNDSLTTKMNVSGRVSADDRWPLGFQVEPFNFKTAKVGQKLRFKTFPVALPKP